MFEGELNNIWILFVVMKANLTWWCSSLLAKNTWLYTCCARVDPRVLRAQPCVPAAGGELRLRPGQHSPATESIRVSQKYVQGVQ